LRRVWTAWLKARRLELGEPAIAAYAIRYSRGLT
jgi:hypothetical protein